MPSKFFLNMLKPKVPSGIALFDVNSTKSSGDCTDNGGAINSKSDNVTIDPTVLHTKIRHLLDCYPSGIRLGTFSDAFCRRFSEDLKPAHYGFMDIENLIRAIPSVAKLVADQEGSGFIVSHVYERNKTNSKIANEAVDVVIMKSESSCKEEIKATAEDKANVPAIQNEVDGTDKPGIQNNKEMVVQDVAENSIYKVISPIKEKLRPLPDKSKDQLRDLLKNHFPSGLTLNELIGAYRGFYGATLEDLDPLQYGYCSLEEMLKANCDFATLKYCGGEIMLHYIDSSTSKCDNSDNSILFEDSWDVKAYISLPAVNAVDPGNPYTTLNAHQLYQPETMTEVVVGEVFSPSDFYIIHRGLDTSQALDALMDQMMEFYSSPIGERYKITKENLQIGAPVAALYKEDDNWYRAIVTGFVDLISVRLFFCDYGTKSYVFNKSLRKLHTHFFDLPVQAIKGRLHGIKPVNDARRLWPRKSSKRLLELLQDKALVANIIKVETDTVYMSLWDTSDSDINVSDILVSEELAKCEEGSSCKEITEEKNNVYSNNSVENPLNTVIKQVEIPQHTNEDINILTEQRYSSNLGFTEINENVPNSGNKNTTLADNIKHSYITKMEPFNNSSLSTKCTNTEQNKLKPTERNIKGLNDNAELITEENFKLNFLLEECNKLLKRENKSTEGINTGKCQPNDLDIRIIENGSIEIDQPVPILASTPRQDNTVPNEAVNISSISQLSITPKKAPSIPPGFNIKLNPSSSVSSIPPGYASLPSNFNEIPRIPQDLHKETDNSILTPLSYLKYDFPIETQSIALDNTILPPLLNQNNCELPIETHFTQHINSEMFIETQCTHITRPQLSTSPSPGFEELPISYSLPKEEQNIQQSPKTNLEDETFFSDEDLGGSSLSLNVACRTVECFSLTSNYTVHILKLSGAPYILSGEISQVLWESDKLRIALAKKKKDLPYVILNQTTHPDIFQQLINMKAAAAVDSFGEPLMSLFAYPLQVVPRILKIFKKDDGVVMKAFQELKMIYKEDPDYIPFDESFVWPDCEYSSQSSLNEDAIQNNENISNLITGSKKKEKSFDEELNLSCDVHGLEDCANFGSNMKVPSNLIGVTPNFICDENYILKNNEYTYNKRLNGHLNGGGENIVNDSSCKNVSDKFVSHSNTHHIKDVISNCISSDTTITHTDKIKPLYEKVGSNISSNGSYRSLEDMDIDNSSNKSTSDTSTFLSTSDTSTLSPETKSLQAIKKRMNLMYKKKQSNLQNLLSKASNKPNQNFNKIKLPKEFTEVNKDLQSNENSMLVNLPNYNSSYDKVQVLKNDSFDNSNNVSQVTNDNDAKTISRYNNNEVETICTNNTYEVETINPHTNNTITTLDDPINTLFDPYSLNFADSIQYEHMLQDMHYVHLNELKRPPPSNTAVYNHYPQSNPMRHPSYMPRMGYMQGLPCIYYPVPTPMFPMVPLPHSKH